MSKQDRQGVRSAADLERKYKLGNTTKVFSQVLGLSDDAREEVERIESQIRSDFREQITSLTRDTERVVMAALESYVESSEMEDFQQTIRGELEVMAEKISMTFTETTSLLDDVNTDLQTVIEEIQKHFEFTVDGLAIKTGEHAMELVLDNDVIRFRKNGQEFGWWDGVSFHTGNLYIGVDEIAQFGNYGFVPYEDETTDGLDFVRVGG